MPSKAECVVTEDDINRIVMISLKPAGAERWVGRVAWVSPARTEFDLEGTDESADPSESPGDGEGGQIFRMKPGERRRFPQDDIFGVQKR